MAKAKLFLIDGHALCYRCFYAVRELMTSKGQPTNAIFGFVNILRKMLRQYQPQYMAVCFDSPEKTHRQKKYAEYKIQRPTMPQDLIDQIPIIKKIVKAYQLPVFEAPGFEADDIIATVTAQAQKKDVEVIIASDDKDMYQLLNKNVKIYNTRQDTVLKQQDLEKRLGFDPRCIVDFIALAGDKSDNIPGVQGVGDVTARQLIGRFGTLEGIYKKINQIESPKVREKLLSQKKEALFSQELALLETQVPIDTDLAKMAVGEPDREKLFEIFQELEFKKWIQEFAPESQQLSADVPVEILKSDKEIKDLVAQIKKKGLFAFLCDVSDKEEERIFQGVVISIDDKKIYSIPKSKMNHLEKLWGDSGVKKITYNLKQALRHLDSEKHSSAKDVFDVLLAAYLLGASQNALRLTELVWTYCNTTVSDEEPVQQVPWVLRLYKQMSEGLKDKSLEKLFQNIEIPLASVLARMEAHGVNLDVALLKKLSGDCNQKITDLTQKLYDMAGIEFNLNSPKQLSHILFEKLGLPVIKKTKTGYSTDEGVLTRLAAAHEFPSLILEYRQLTKLKSTYIDALPKLVDPKTGRLHAHFNQVGTETGRLSSDHPNLQNIPIRTDLGRQIRKAIIPSQKNLLMLAADYSQIELRILAHLSQDTNLKKAFATDQDIHQFTASLIFDVEEKEVTPRMRDAAKRVNFGIIYGMSAFGLSRDLKTSAAEAQEFIEKYFLRYPNVKKFMDQTIKDCEKKGYVTTLLNRRRYIPEIKSKNMSLRQFAQRQAINTPVQGSAADLIKLAMINVEREMKKSQLQSRMLITVHDELVFEIPKSEKDQMIHLVREHMEHPFKISVPIKVSLKHGPNWLEMKEIA